MLLNDLEQLRKLAKNKTQLIVLERLYNNYALNSTNEITLEGARQIDQSFCLADKNSLLFKVRSTRLDYQAPKYYLVYQGA